MSAFRMRKCRTYFSLFDLDKDGVISREDWIEMAVRFTNFENADQQKADRFSAPFANVWEQFVKHNENKKKITMDEFCQSFEKLRNDPEFMKHQLDLLHGFYELMDLNKDGYLQQDEHYRLFVELGVPDASFAELAFKAIDVNGDGKLSFEELLRAFFDFLFSDDENSPNRFYFGPLLD